MDQTDIQVILVSSMAKSIDTARELVSILPLAMRVLGANVRRHPSFQEPSQLRLMHILAHLGRCKIGMLAEKMAVSLPTMSKTMRRMAQRRWVSLVRDDQDRRAVWAEITPEGRAALEEVYEQTAQHMEHLIETLTPEEHTQLTAGLIVMRSLFESANTEMTAAHVVQEA